MKTSLIRWISFVAVLALVLGPRALPAQPRPRERAEIELLQVAYGARRVVDEGLPREAGVDFVIGRDNMAFPNLTGLWGMPGDCYAFSLTAKLFKEGARWRAGGDGNTGFSFPGLVQHFESGGSRPFEVQGYPSLFDLSDSPTMTEERAISYLRGDTSDVTVRNPLDVLQSREKMKYQLVVFLNMVQILVQGQAEMAEGVRQVVLNSVGGATGGERHRQAVRRVTLDTVTEVKSAIAGGHLCPISMLNMGVPSGHVILAYRYVQTDTHVDLYVYDCNVQHGAERGESILRINNDASEITYHKKSGGSIAPDAIYDGSPFFSQKDTLVILKMRGLGRAEMQRMAHTVAFADRINLFFDATSQLISGLGDQTRTLRRIIREFVIRIQDGQDRLGISYIPADGRITERSTVTELNEFLERHTQVALRAISPHALPQGVRLENPRLVLHPTDENRAQVGASLVVSPGSPLPAFVRAIHSVGLLMNDRTLTEWMQAVQTRLGDEHHMNVSFGMDVTKNRPARGGGGSGLPDLSGITPDLLWLHGVIGNMEPSPHDSFVRNSPYRIEIAESTLNGAMDIAAKGLHLYGDEEAEILRFGSAAGDIDVRLEAADLDLQGSSRGTSGVISVNSRVRAMARGYEFAVDPLTARFRVDHNQPQGLQRIRASGRLTGELRLPGGFRGLVASTAVDVLNANSDALRRLVNDVVTEDLLERTLGFRLVSFDTSERIPELAVGPARISALTGWTNLDLAAARNAWFDFDIPIEVCQLHVKDDRLVLAARRPAARAE